MAPKIDLQVILEDFARYDGDLPLLDTQDQLPQGTYLYNKARLDYINNVLKPNINDFILKQIQPEINKLN